MWSPRHSTILLPPDAGIAGNCMNSGSDIMLSSSCCLSLWPLSLVNFSFPCSRFRKTGLVVAMVATRAFGCDRLETRSRSVTP